VICFTRASFFLYIILIIFVYVRFFLGYIVPLELL